MREVKMFALGIFFSVGIFMFFGLVLAATVFDAKGGTIANVGTPIANTDAANKAYVDSAGGGTFEGLTATTYNGSELNGMIGANEKCARDYSGSHICSYDEFRTTGRSSALNATGWIYTPELSPTDVCGGLGNSSEPRSITGETRQTFSHFSKTLWPSGSVYPDVDIEIMGDGLPAVVYANGSAGYGLYKCDDVYCSTGSAYQLGTDGGFDTTADKEMAIEKSYDGFPLVAYVDSGGDPNLIICHDQTCSSSTTKELTTSADAGGWFDVEINISGNPFVAYQATDNTYYVVSCSDVNCTTATATQQSPSTILGRNADIEIPHGGNPIVFNAFDSSSDRVYYNECANVACSSTATLTFINLGTSQSPQVSDVAAVMVNNSWYGVYASTGVVSNGLWAFTAVGTSGIDVFKVEDQGVGSSWDNLDVFITSQNQQLYVGTFPFGGSMNIIRCQNRFCDDQGADPHEFELPQVEEDNEPEGFAYALTNDDLIIGVYTEPNNDNLYFFSETRMGSVVSAQGALKQDVCYESPNAIACCS